MGGAGETEGEGETGQRSREETAARPSPPFSHQLCEPWGGPQLSNLHQAPPGSHRPSCDRGLGTRQNGGWEGTRSALRPPPLPQTGFGAPAPPPLGSVLPQPVRASLLPGQRCPEAPLNHRPLTTTGVPQVGWKARERVRVGDGEGLSREGGGAAWEEAVCPPSRGPKSRENLKRDA